ncbi:alpha-alpha-trehalase precursor [Encephalitozoon romaleae SJ-2008]|uniref:Trehalase n=1 Tax=Encephalitozoon romaleae (strain SJ-2008) TaxID=1178016 RepID=I6ZHC5_ENCRO|nr:alpha-alpha-trehalase precursor [Encephalitozoon romaleae SJ-2008]AFN82603.1 alpha-alpha-trehalase precursor [Encephalitozoon romaleae SJ-2008]
MDNVLKYKNFKKTRNMKPARLVGWILAVFTVHAASPAKVPLMMGTDPHVSSELLEASFRCKISRDSKSLVDRVYTKPPEEINALIIEMLKENRGFTGEQDFWRFVSEHSFIPEAELIFAKDDEDLLQDIPSEEPGYIAELDKILVNSGPLCQDHTYNQKLENLLRVARQLNSEWKNIYVKQRDLDEGNHTTMIKVENPFIIPGDRFKEAYYWDSYWVIEGLVRNGMQKVAKGMVENFISLIENIGFIPNGLRKYYLNRSQPPYFPQMLFTLYRHLPWEEIEDVIKRGLNAAVVEHEFFMREKSENVVKDGKTHILNVYKVRDTTPRAESYSEDRMTTEENKAREEKYRRRSEEIYSELKAGAESGWDFSTRWLGLHGQLDSIRTSRRIPADLNAMMYANECIISKLYEIVEGKDSRNSQDFKRKSEERIDAINSVLWCDREGVWNDYDIDTKEHTSSGFYASNIMPMCYGIKPPEGKDVTVYNILNMFVEDMFGHPGGMPVSGAKNKNSTLQWDYPNVWPPLVHAVALFLERIGEREMALHMAKSFLENISISTSVVDEEKRGIFEKYSCENAGCPGYKGEYMAQKGFGWTNGVAIHFLDIFGLELISSKTHEESYKAIKVLLSMKVNSKEIPANHTPERCLLLEC